MLINAMTQEEWLTQYIASAFVGVQLEDGIDIHAAESRDYVGNLDEDRLSLTAERIDWRRVRSDILYRRHCAMTYLDATGFRFYTPAIMTSVMQHEAEDGMLLGHFLFNLKVTIHGKIKNVPFVDLFTKHQRAAIIRFLKYLIHHGGPGRNDCDAKDRLDEIQNRTPY